ILEVAERGQRLRQPRHRGLGQAGAAGDVLVAEVAFVGVDARLLEAAQDRERAYHRIDQLRIAAVGVGGQGLQVALRAAHQAASPPACFLSSSRAMASRCTSSGPSARRRVRLCAQALARKPSWLTPAAPCASTAQSTTFSPACGAITLLIAISARAALLPPVSIIRAAFITISRAWSSRQRDSAMRSRHTEWSATARPNACREASR